jgi:hypothetical protein
MRRLVLGLAVFAAFLFAAPAVADNVITFEDNALGQGPTLGLVGGIGSYQATGSTYVNQWGNPDHDLEGFVTLAQSGGGLTVNFVSPTMFSGLDYAAYSQSGTGSQDLIVNGYLNNLLVGSESFSLDNTSTFFPSYSNWTTFAPVNLAGVSIDQLDIFLNASSTSVQAIDNVRFGAAASVPEPGTWATMLLGFGAVGFAMRRRRRLALT